MNELTASRPDSRLVLSLRAAGFPPGGVSSWFIAFTSIAATELFANGGMKEQPWGPRTLVREPPSRLVLQPRCLTWWEAPLAAAASHPPTSRYGRESSCCCASCCRMRNSACQSDNARHNPGRSGLPARISASIIAISRRHRSIHAGAPTRSSATSSKVRPSLSSTARLPVYS